MTDPSAIPDWLPLYLPDTRDWVQVTPQRFQGVADPQLGKVFDHVLVVCDPPQTRYMSSRIADFAPARTHLDMFEYSFSQLERKLNAKLAEDRADAEAPYPRWGTIPVEEFNQGDEDSR